MFAVIGIIIGLLLGLTGAGGSVFAVPLLIFVAGLPPEMAMGMSLAAVSVGAASGSVSAIKNKQVFLWPAVILIVSGFMTAPLGRILAGYTSDSVLMVGFSMLSLCIAAWMWLSASKTPSRSYIVRSGLSRSPERSAMLCPLSDTGVFQLKKTCVAALALAGLVVGFLSGLLGVGGGFLIVPLLLSFSGMAMQKAVGTSLLIITLISAVGFTTYLITSERVDLYALSFIVSGSVVGMFLSRFMAKHIAGPVLQKLFSVVLTTIACVVIVENIL